MEGDRAAMTYDLIVIGAGPGGCSTAITAAREGASVLLLERGRFPRHKVCGEFVSAESLELLEGLLAPQRRVLISSAPRIARTRIFSDNAEVHATIDPAAASIARHDLDLALWESAREQGVDARSEYAVKSVNAVGDARFCVSTERGLFEGRALVNATGRWSFLSSAATRARAANHRWVGLKAHFHEEAPANSVDLYFFRGGYCGVQPVRLGKENSGLVVNACAMVRADVATELTQVFAAHPALRERSKHWKLAMTPVSTAPLVFHPPEPVQDAMIQVGDAATFVDPFIGDGISLALRSGEIAGWSLRPFFRNECSLAQVCADYEREYRRQLAPVFRASSQLRKFMQLPGLVRRPVMSLLQRTPAITRQLVRMTR